MSLRRSLLVLCLVVGLGVGCSRLAPIQNFSEVSYPTGPIRSSSLPAVERAILSGGAELGWSISKVNQGHMIGTLYRRSHNAVVDIYYTTKNYSIIYKESTNLKAEGNMIHKNYNSWVVNLNTHIRSKLVSAGM